MYYTVLLRAVKKLTWLLNKDKKEWIFLMNCQWLLDNLHDDYAYSEHSKKQSLIDTPIFMYFLCIRSPGPGLATTAVGRKPRVTWRVVCRVSVGRVERSVGGSGWWWGGWWVMGRSHVLISTQVPPRKPRPTQVHRPLTNRNLPFWNFTAALG